MSKIEFVSHDKFPDDEYTKELVYLCLEGKYRVAYVRKAAKNGGLFWSVASVGATRNGKKEFFDAFIQDSNFVEKDIRNFLEARSWERGSVYVPPEVSTSDRVSGTFLPKSMYEAKSDGLPF